MKVLVRFTPRSMTTHQYQEAFRQLEEDQWPPAGLEYHVCAGSEGDLRVTEVWDSRDDFEAFGSRLRPVLAQVGIDAGEPEVLDIHRLVRR